MRTGSLSGTMSGHFWHIVSTGVRCLGYSLPGDGRVRILGKAAGTFLFLRINVTMSCSARPFGGYFLDYKSLWSISCISQKMHHEEEKTYIIHT